MESPFTHIPIMVHTLYGTYPINSEICDIIYSRRIWPSERHTVCEEKYFMNNIYMQYSSGNQSYLIIDGSPGDLEC